MILDSLLVAAGAGLALLGNNVPTASDLFIVGKTFLIFFVAQLGFEKGVKPYYKKKASV